MEGLYFIGTSDTIEAHFCFLVTMKIEKSNRRLSNLPRVDCPLFANLKKKIEKVLERLCGLTSMSNKKQTDEIKIVSGKKEL